MLGGGRPSGYAARQPWTEDDVDRDERDEVDLVAELREAVERRVPDDVMVRETDDGFAVGFRHPFEDRIGSTQGQVRSWAMVRCDPATMTLRIEDMRFSAGTDRLTGKVGVAGFRGRENAVRSVAVYAPGPDGEPVLVERQVQRTSTLHGAVRGPAAELGWHEKQPLSATVGKVVGAIAGAGALLTLVVLGVLALTGRLG